MPLYEYRCNDCGKEFEKMVRFSETGQNPACPSCEGQDTRKMISSFASLGNSPAGAGVAASSSCSSGGAFR